MYGLLKDNILNIIQLQGMYEKIIDLEIRGITFKNMCAEAQTPDGKKFLEGFINLKEKMPTKDGYELYCFDNENKIKKWIKTFPKYIEKYNKLNHII